MASADSKDDLQKHQPYQHEQQEELLQQQHQQRPYYYTRKRAPPAPKCLTEEEQEEELAASSNPMTCLDSQTFVALVFVFGLVFLPIFLWLAWPMPPDVVEATCIVDSVVASCAYNPLNNSRVQDICRVYECLPQVHYITNDGNGNTGFGPLTGRTTFLVDSPSSCAAYWPTNTSLTCWFGTLTRFDDPVIARELPPELKSSEHLIRAIIIIFALVVVFVLSACCYFPLCRCFYLGVQQFRADRVWRAELSVEGGRIALAACPWLVISCFQLTFLLMSVWCLSQPSNIGAQHSCLTNYTALQCNQGLSSDRRNPYPTYTCWCVVVSQIDPPRGNASLSPAEQHIASTRPSLLLSSGYEVRWSPPVEAVWETNTSQACAAAFPAGGYYGCYPETDSCTSGCLLSQWRVGWCSGEKTLSQWLIFTLMLVVFGVIQYVIAITTFNTNAEIRLFWSHYLPGPSEEHPPEELDQQFERFVESRPWERVAGGVVTLTRATAQFAASASQKAAEAVVDATSRLAHAAGVSGGAATADETATGSSASSSSSLATATTTATMDSEATGRTGDDGGDGDDGVVVTVGDAKALEGVSSSTDLNAPYQSSCPPPSPSPPQPGSGSSSSSSSSSPQPGSGSASSSRQKR